MRLTSDVTDLGHFGARYVSAPGVIMDILSDKLPEEILPLLDWFEENYIGNYIEIDIKMHVFLQICGLSTNEF
jgi:hypothetical protein